MSDSRAAQRDLERLVRRMVDHPEDVHVDASRDRGGTVFKLRLAQEDLGKVIGRKGSTARALRALLEARGDLDEQRYGLEIRES